MSLSPARRPVFPLPRHTALRSSSMRRLTRYARRMDSNASLLLTSRPILPYPGIRRIGPEFPASAIEGLDPQGGDIDIVQATHVDHVFRWIGSRPIERRDPAIAAKQMARRHRPELIRYEVSRPGKKSKIVGGHHVMQVRLLGTDRAIALACASHVGRDVKTDSPAVTAPCIGSLWHDASRSAMKVVSF
jgi:hypothetical protein